MVDPVAASVNGQIFNDTNANGVQNAGEIGRPDVPVSLFFAGADGVFGGVGDVLIGTVNTSAAGDYSFTGLAPGVYYLSAAPPAGLGFSPIDQGGNDALDSDFDPLTHRTAVFTLTAGQNDTSRDGLLAAPVRRSTLSMSRPTRESPA